MASDFFNAASNTNFTVSGDPTEATVGAVSWEVLLGSTDLKALPNLVYFEAEVVAANPTGGSNYSSWGIGVANDSLVPTAGFAGENDSNGFMADAANSGVDFWYNTSDSSRYGLGNPCIPGDRVAIALDKTHGKIWWRNITSDADTGGMTGRSGGGPGVTRWCGNGGSGGGTDDPTTPSTGYDIASLCAGSHIYIAFSADGTGATVTGKLHTKASSFLGTMPVGYADVDVPIAPDIDGSVSGSVISNHLTLNLDTTTANLAVVAFCCNNNTGTVTSPSLTWTRRASIAASGFFLELHTAPISGALSSEAVRADITAVNYIAMVVFGLSNVDSHDTDGALPLTGNNTTLDLSTDTAQDILLYLGGNTFGTSESVPSDFTQIETTQVVDGLRLLVAYQRVNEVQSSLAFVRGSGQSGIVDAFLGGLGGGGGGGGGGASGIRSGSVIVN